MKSEKPQNATNAAKSLQGFTFTCFHEELKKGIPKFVQNWTVVNMFAAGTKRSHIISAYAHGGKSTLATQLVVAVSKGEPFLGFQTIQGRAIYWGTEDNKAEILDRIQAQGGTLEGGIFLGSSSAVSRKQSYEELRFAIEYMQSRTDLPVGEVRICVIETTQEFFQPKDGSNEEWGMLLREFNRFIQDYPNIAFILLHQFNKGEHGDSLLKRISGASQIVANTHTKLCLETDESRDNKRLFVVYPRGRGQQVPPTYLNFDAEKMTSTVGELQSEIKKRERKQDEADNFTKWCEAVKEYLTKNPQGASCRALLSKAVINVPLATTRKLEGLETMVIAEALKITKVGISDIYTTAPDKPSVQVSDADAFDASEAVTAAVQ